MIYADFHWLTKYWVDNINILVGGILFVDRTRYKEGFKNEELREEEEDKRIESLEKMIFKLNSNLKSRSKHNLKQEGRRSEVSVDLNNLGVFARLLVNRKNIELTSTRWSEWEWSEDTKSKHMANGHKTSKNNK